MPDPTTEPTMPAIPSGTTPQGTSSITVPFDPSTFESDLKEVGRIFGEDDWGAKNYKEKLSKVRSTIGRQGREMAEIKTQLEQVQPFLQAWDSDGGLRAAVEAYYSNGGVQASPQSSYAGPVSSLDPVQRRLNDFETQLATQRIDSQLDSLSSRGYPLDEAMRDTIHKSMQENRFGTAENHYMMLFGRQLIEARAEEAARAATEAIRSNNSMYSPAPSRSAPAGVPQVHIEELAKDPAKLRAAAAARWTEMLNNRRG